VTAGKILCDAWTKFSSLLKNLKSGKTGLIFPGKISRIFQGIGFFNGLLADFSYYLHIAASKTTSSEANNL